MTQHHNLQRLNSLPYLPFPRAIRVADYIYTSSIYPLDDEGKVVAAPSWLGLAADSEITIQTVQCLDRLKSALEELGSSLSHVVKVDVHLAFASDFYEFKAVWRRFFPIDPPARLTIEVGETFPFPGVRLNLDAIAISGDSAMKREVLSDPQGPAALDAEWASDAIRAGNLVFCSGFTASDFQRGLAVGKAKGFPNYGNDAEMQAIHVFDRLDRVLSQACTSVEHTVETQLYEPNLLTFHNVDKEWGGRMPLPPTRSSIGVKGLLVPGATFVPNFTVLIPDAQHKKEESREGILWHPEQRKVNYSPTIKAGRWRFFSGQIATDDYRSAPVAPEGLPNHFSSIEIQTRMTLNLLSKQLEANETDWAHCFHVRVYLTDPLRDYRGFMRVWNEYFPDSDKAPTVAYIPSTAMMFDGPLVEIDPTCVAVP